MIQVILAAAIGFFIGKSEGYRDFARGLKDGWEDKDNG